MSRLQREISLYVGGYVVAVLLSVAGYMVATSGERGLTILLIIGGLVLVQLIVQLVCFLHLGFESGSRLKLWSFLFMTLILLIIVAGSIWIMHHLNYNMMDMTPTEKDQYMTGQKDKGF